MTATTPETLTDRLTRALAGMSPHQAQTAARHLADTCELLNRTGNVDAGDWRAAVDAAVSAAVGTP